MTVQCSANLRTLGQALTMYTHQYHYYPGAFVSIMDGNGPYAIWAPRLRAMLKGNQGAFYCPAADPRCQWGLGVASPTTAATPPLTQFGYQEGELLLPQGRTWFSYGYNIHGTYSKTGGTSVSGDASSRGLGRGEGLPANGSFGTGFAPIKASRVKVQSEMVAIADSAGIGRIDFEIYCFITGWGTFSNTFLGPRHQAGANVLFCDGHVQWYPKEDILGPEHGMVPDRIRRMWNNDHEP